MNIDKLKQKILDLAIRGKLVPQDPKDEPASVLIDKIREEKKRLVKQGKIKAEKEESYIYKGSDNCYYENYFGNLPKKWILCKFGSIVNIYRGASPRPIKQHLTSELDGIPWIKIGDTKPGEIYINKTANKIKKESVNKSVFVRKGTLVLSNSMSFGRPYILNIDGCIHDGWLAIEIINNTIDINFLQYILQGYMWYFKIKATGTGVSNLNIDRVLNMPFALPPLKEQKRILAFLIKTDNIFNKISNNTILINKLSQQLKLKLLEEIFGENSSYKSYYKNYLLKKVSNITMGQSIPSDKITSKYNKSCLEFHQGKLNFGKYLLQKANKYTQNYKKVAIKGSILISVRAPVGALNFTDRVVAIGRGLCAISANQDTVLSQYLYFYLQYLIPYFKRKSTGSTFQAITIDLIRSCNIKIPSLEKQKDITIYLVEIFKLIDSISNQAN